MKSKVLTKFLSAAFSAVLAVSTFAPLSLVAGAESAAWDGTQSAPTVGEGTAESPLEIGKAAELAWLVNQSEEDTTGKYYKLTADIALNDTSSANWQASAKAWYVQNDAADAATFFAGHFDGDGHTVSGLYFGDRLNAAQSELAFWSLDAGLFPTLAAGATIENLGIINSQITANDICSGKGEVYAGLIAGKGYATTDNPITIKNCFADDTNTVVSKNAVGGLIGFSNGALVAENCYSSAKLESKFVSENGNIQIGGIVGQVDKEFTAENCYSVHARLAKEYWVNTTFNYTNCYTTAIPVKDENPAGVTQPDDVNKMFGEGAVAYMGFDSSVWVDTDKSPALRIFTEPSIVIGDLNDDSVINAEDITLMRKALLLGYTDEVYDVNGDSDVNILDLISLKKLAD